MNRTIHIAITATCTGKAARLDDEALAKLVERLLAIGQEDAQDTLKRGEGSMRDAERALAVTFQSTTVSEG